MVACNAESLDHFHFFSQAISLMSSQNTQHILITDPSSLLYTRFSACQEKRTKMRIFTKPRTSGFPMSLRKKDCRTIQQYAVLFFVFLFYLFADFRSLIPAHYRCGFFCRLMRFLFHPIHQIFKVISAEILFLIYSACGYLRLFRQIM